MDDFHTDLEGDSLLAGIDLDKSVTSTGLSQSVTETNQLPLCVPDSFPDFPYPNPYPQQLALMRALYGAAENAHCAVLESPTGTGKSVSLLTASIRWLLDHNFQLKHRLTELTERMDKLNAGGFSTQDDWIVAYEQIRSQKRSLAPEIEELTQVNTCLELIHDLKTRLTEQTAALSRACSESSINKAIKLAERSPLKQLNEQTTDSTRDKVDEDEFLIASDKTDNGGDDDMEDQESSENSAREPDQNSLLHLIYCSRTHSQLSQCLQELAKCSTLFNQITVLQLSSRKMVCTNPNIHSLGHAEMINEACLELVRSNNKGCSMRNATAVNRLSNYLLSGVCSTDVAMAVRERRYTSLFGKQFQTCNNEKLVANRVGCPYYATRKALPLAQLILVPYATLLQPSARAASGLKLNNSILIIDEAHNLLEATTSSLSVLVTFGDLCSVLAAFRAYQDRYRTRLAGSTALRLRQLIHFIQRLQMLLLERPESVAIHQRTDSTVTTVTQMLSQAGVDNISLHELVSFLHHKHLINKLAGFSKWLATKQQHQKADEGEEVDGNRPGFLIPSGMQTLLAGMKRKRDQLSESSIQTENPTAQIAELGGASTSLFKVQTFLEALITGGDDARIVITPLNTTRSDETNSTGRSDASLYFTVLNPGRYLQDLVRQARCVFLAGGTMKPVEEFIEQVFVAAGKPSTDIVTFSCDHVINPMTQLAVFPIAETSDGVQLDFTYQQRSSPAVMDACGEVTLQVCKRTPGGVIVFLPSYDYQQTLCTRWESTGLSDRLSQFKRVFREPRNASNLKEIMLAYTKAIKDTASGALLISVIGGKLSEGINFSDELARSILIIGMPYPNPHCPLLKEKMAYLDREFGHRPIYRSISPGRQHYEALCMRAINQAIGRAVRHAKDYAAVFLIDRRFARLSVQQRLPDWVFQSLRNSLEPATSAIALDTAMEKLGEFFISASNSVSLE